MQKSQKPGSLDHGPGINIQYGVRSGHSWVHSIWWLFIGHPLGVRHCSRHPGETAANTPHFLPSRSLPQTSIRRHSHGRTTEQHGRVWPCCQRGDPTVRPWSLLTYPELLWAAREGNSSVLWAPQRGPLRALPPPVINVAITILMAHTYITLTYCQVTINPLH